MQAVAHSWGYVLLIVSSYSGGELLLNRFRMPFFLSTFCREELEKQYQGKLTQQMNGPINEVLSRVMKAVASKKIVVPGNYRR